MGVLYPRSMGFSHLFQKNPKNLKKQAGAGTHTQDFIPIKHHVISVITSSAAEANQ